jgi:protoporphyrin/coproporphyrin ferrochelatase
MAQSAPHKHYVFFRYANPLTEISLQQMQEDGVTRAIAFSQYPQWSCTTAGSSMNHLWRELDRLNLTNAFSWSLIDRWSTHPGYIRAVANRVKLGLEQYAPEDRDKVIIMFSAHSVPMNVVNKGDPYTKEISATTERVMEALNVPNAHILSWQSKVGYLPWMGPSTSNVIKGFGAQGKKYVAVSYLMDEMDAYHVF